MMKLFEFGVALLLVCFAYPRIEIKCRQDYWPQIKNEYLLPKVKEKKLFKLERWLTTESVKSDTSLKFIDKNEIVKIAKQYIGVPYEYGGESVDSGMDCSYFVQYVYAQEGIDLPRTAQSQFFCGTKVDKSELEPGDLLFFRNYIGISHVAIYIGQTRFIHATGMTGDVSIASLNEPYYKNHFLGAKKICHEKGV